MIISHAAAALHPMLATNGHTLPPMYPTSTSPTTPDTMATTQLSVVMCPNTPLSRSSLPPSPRAWYSVIIHASNTLNSSVVLTPPASRPTNSTARLSLNMVAHVTTYMAQYTRHASRRPCRSASSPAKEALAAPEMKPAA